MRGRTETRGTTASSPPISFETSSRPSSSQPRASASSCVQSPTTPAGARRARGQRGCSTESCRRPRERGRTEMNREAVLLGRRRERERVPLPKRDGRAVDHDVLARARSRFLLLDLQLDRLARVDDDLAQIRAVTRADLAQDALRDVDDAADRPAAGERRGGRRQLVALGPRWLPRSGEGQEEQHAQDPEDADLGPGAVGRLVWPASRGYEVSLSSRRGRRRTCTHRIMQNICGETRRQLASSRAKRTRCKSGRTPWSCQRKKKTTARWCE